MEEEFFIMAGTIAENCYFPMHSLKGIYHLKARTPYSKYQVNKFFATATLLVYKSSFLLSTLVDTCIHYLIKRLYFNINLRVRNDNASCSQLQYELLCGYWSEDVYISITIILQFSFTDTYTPLVPKFTR